MIEEPIGILGRLRYQLNYDYAAIADLLSFNLVKCLEEADDPQLVEQIKNYLDENL